MWLKSDSQQFVFLLFVKYFRSLLIRLLKLRDSGGKHAVKSNHVIKIECRVVLDAHKF